MTEDRARRSKTPKAPEPVSGYRQTRRGSKSAKSAKRAEKQHALVVSADKAVRGFRNLLIVTTRGLGAVGLIVLGLLLVATGINTYARWNAVHGKQDVSSPKEQERRARENILIIGVEGGKAVGYLAMRVDRAGSQVFGVAIPEGAFIDIPGQGFERVGEAYAPGAQIALAAISNYLTVPFTNYLAVSEAAYSDAIARQSVAGLPKAVLESNLTQKEILTLTKDLAGIDQKNVALVPLPVKPIKLGDQTYFEPQRSEVADLLKSWWGVSAADELRAVRVIVYNGAGKPGLAGEASQVLIRAGFRVVDTKNADNFKYTKTRVVVRRGDLARGDSVKKALGVGVITVEPSSSDVTDVIVIIGKDYRPPVTDSKGTQ
ncbi:MAG: hypothetical protein CVT67_07140 [Actinobacteria bacterium HGW-Actinobacteria-7]|jgi:hypothetical protein|nr:MAG: hypothetical protein CVT67_07140 [Actinobacteria bacterium HGW-Actinobacteria-7]